MGSMMLKCIILCNGQRWSGPDLLLKEDYSINRKALDEGVMVYVSIQLLEGDEAPLDQLTLSYGPMPAQTQAGSSSRQHSWKRGMICQAASGVL